ncbi:MAG: thiol-disulfide oxidoreductase DCC family protein [Candidatus Rokuibacteriota bacterium]
MERAVLIYDGDCAMCRGSALWLMRRAKVADLLEILPCRSRPRRERYPQLSDEACMQAMQLVLADGRILSGADAVPELLRRVRGWRWVASVFGLPPLLPFTRRLYAWIARHRMRLSCGLRP